MKLFGFWILSRKTMNDLHVELEWLKSDRARLIENLFDE
jgi:hypothetical protein